MRWLRRSCQLFSSLSPSRSSMKSFSRNKSKNQRLDPNTRMSKEASQKRWEERCTSESVTTQKRTTTKASMTSFSHQANGSQCQTRKAAGSATRAKSWTRSTKRIGLLNLVKTIVGCRSKWETNLPDQFWVKWQKAIKWIDEMIDYFNFEQLNKCIEINLNSLIKDCLHMLFDWWWLQSKQIRQGSSSSWLSSCRVSTPTLSRRWSALECQALSGTASSQIWGQALWFQLSWTLACGRGGGGSW